MKPTKLLILAVGVAMAVHYRGSIEEVRQEFLSRQKSDRSPVACVRAEFDEYVKLVMSGNEVSESFYRPDTLFRYITIDAMGRRHEKRLSAREHLRGTQKVFPLVRSGRLRVRFEDIRCAERIDGKVEVRFVTRTNEGPPGKGVFVFAKSDQARWAIVEEVHVAE